MYPKIDMPGGWEWLIILVIVVFVFGAAKLPDLARGTGQALRIFKAETRGMKDDEKKSTDAAALSSAELETNRAKLDELDARQAELDAERERLNRGESA